MEIYLLFNVYCNIMNLDKFSCDVSEADKKGDTTTLDRCLQRHLVLVNEIKLGNDLKTLLPQGYWQEGETLRQVCVYFILKMER